MMLYIHIPFCRRICSYCDFFHTTCFDLYPDVINKIIDDITLLKGEKIETIYIGGGTPSTLKTNDIERIFDAIFKTTDTTELTEITFEANPDDITTEYTKFLHSIGINRLSIGIQSFNDVHLKKMNRRHNCDNAIKAVKTAQKCGFDNISVDLIYGLPFMTIEELKYNLLTTIDLGIQHVSAYHLTIEEGTIFARQHLSPVDETTSELHYQTIRQILTEKGPFKQYEISNFSLPGYEAIHNSGYWSGKAYTGIGPSAHSFDGSFQRKWNPSNINDWLQDKNIGFENLTIEERDEEIIITSLRTVKGFKTNDTNILSKAKRFIQSEEMVYTTDGYLQIKPCHFLISDYIISELL